MHVIFSRTIMISFNYVVYQQIIMKLYSGISAVFLLLVKEYQMLLKRYDTTELPKVSAAGNKTKNSPSEK